MDPKKHIKSLAVLCLGVFLIFSCSAPPDLRQGESIPLTSFTDTTNGINVSVLLSHTSTGAFLLVATFTPPKGYHLYSKDIPITGVRGQGRPTLIELPAGARIQAEGSLTESVQAESPGYVPDGAPVYPSGPVTLTLPVRLPDQTGWLTDKISLTYMACTDLICTTPTVGKLVDVKIPGAKSVTQ